MKDDDYYWTDQEHLAYSEPEEQMEQEARDCRLGALRDPTFIPGNWTEERGSGMQDKRYAEMEKKYGIHPDNHFHWRVLCIFEDGFTHTSDWHAKIGDAQRLVTEESKIEYELKNGKRRHPKSIECFPLDFNGEPVPEKPKG